MSGQNIFRINYKDGSNDVKDIDVGWLCLISSKKDEIFFFSLLIFFLYITTNKNRYFSVLSIFV